ncbi:MAG TPA: tetratricopeptide repeat protein, partial [Kofleriaceae bacterium]
MSDDLAEIKRTAVQRPHDVQAQMAAAYAHDRAGDEAAAIRYYDAAFALGIPSTEVRGFLVGYGSTLRNVGRADEAVAILAQAIADDPAYPP